MRLRNRQAIPLVDALRLHDPARRTTIVRVVLAAALVAVVAAAALLAYRVGSNDAALAKGANSGVVVLDLSASIGRPDRRSVDPLDYLADSGQDFGLVLFSGIPYEAVPPGTSSAELRPIIRAISPFPNVCLKQRGVPCAPGTREIPADSKEAALIRRKSVTPWDRSYRGGTVISLALKMAREILERHNAKARGVLLISDLDDSLLDISLLTRELITYRNEKIPVRIVALNPFDDDRAFFERLVGRENFVDYTDLAPGRLLDARDRAKRAGVPEGLAGLGLLLLMLLALNEHFCGRLSWRSER